MAIKKIQIIPPDNGYNDILHPETSVDMVIGLDRFGTASGTNAYVVSIPNTTLSEGQRILVKFTNANTGASTLNVNGQGAKSITKAGGAALSAGNIKAGGIYSLAYGGTSFQLLGEGGEYGTALAGDVLAPKTIGTESGIVTGTMPNNGAINNTITTQGGSYTIPNGYHNGSGKVTASFANLVAEDIVWGKKVGGVTGRSISFSREYPTFTSSIHDIAYDGEGMYVAVGDGGELASSPDGVNWTRRTSRFGENYIYAVLYVNEQWYAFGGGGYISTSTNGISWTLKRSSGSTLRYVTYGNGTFVGFNSNSTAGLYTSTDGINWAPRTGPGSSINFVTFGNGMFIAGSNAYNYKTSVDGISWVSRQLPSVYAKPRSAIYVDGQWVIGGEKIYTSPTGIDNWTERSPGVFNEDCYIYSIDYYDGVYIAVGYNSNLAVSYDSINWEVKMNNVAFNSATHNKVLITDEVIIVGGLGRFMST